MSESISAIAKVLLPVAKSLSSKVRRVYKERKAGKMPIGGADDLLEKGMEETLNRLVNGKTDDAWWKKTLDTIGHKLISPEFLRIHAVREWLSAHQVQTDFKSLAREHIMGKDDYEQDTLKRLRQTYADKTGEDERLADGPVEIIVAIIAAGYFGSIRPEIEPVVGMIQDHAQESNKAFKKFDESLGSIDNRLKDLGPDHYVEETHNKNAQYELDQLLKRRSLELDHTLQEIIILRKRVLEGDLIHAHNSTKAEVLYWTARLQVSKTETLPIARENLKQLLHLAPGTDIRVIDALILETEGDADAALRILRDIDDPDGRSTFFTVCNRKQGIESALLWFEEQPERDNPDLFTGIGWANLAITLAKKDMWIEAAERLAVVQEFWDRWPDLAFVEGVINVALLLPEELRQYALEMNLFHPTIKTIEGSVADKHRACSKACFEKAHELFIGIDQKGRAQAALDWHLWLRLTDPNPEISRDAKLEVSEGMKEVPRAIDLIPFARSFEIEFDEGPIKRHLAKRKRTGGLEHRELQAELFLAEMKMSPKERADFIHNEEERLSQVMLKATLSGLLIEALVEDGQTKRARETLEERKDDFVGHDYQRFQTMIDTKDGTDPRAKLEDIYTQTDSIIDLKNLVSHLKLAGDWDALQPRLEELFQREKTAANALMLTYCLRRNSRVDYFSILTFLEENQDIVDSSKDLLSEKAWTLSRAGRLKEAEVINTELLKRRDNENDLELDINIALQLGDWDRFSVIINNAMSSPEKLGPNMLIRLASLSAEVDADNDRAFELLKMAANKGSDDPQLLMEAYVLAVQIGREDQTSSDWFVQAMDLSPDDGPFKKVDIRTLAEEMMPARRERIHEVERALITGEISLQAAANNLGQSVSRILVEIPRINTNLQDGRRRTVVPIRSGSRRNVEMKSVWKVCLDATSIMVLKHLDLLEETINAFQKILLNSDTMIFLLNERRRARFHQPSRIKRAEEFRSLLDQGLLKIAPQIPNSPQDLIKEVGRDFADMLEAARAGGGRVIRPFPIFKSGSFMEREAELGDYADYIISTKALIKVLYEKKGAIDSGTFNRAYQYLTTQDRGREANEDQQLIDCPLYLDELSITYFQHIDLLNVICNSGLEAFVHPSTVAYQSSLVEESRGGIILADKLNEIRIILRKALEQEKATFLPRPRWVNGAKKFESFYQIAPTIANIVEDSGGCDAVCVDDRFFNKHRAIIDKKERSIPLVCVTDILQHLEIQGVISAEEMHIKFHKLRQAGYAFVPIPFEELEQYLNNVTWDKDGFLIESAGMRLMRQTLMRIRSLDMVVLPEESPFLEQIQLGCVLVIRRIWSNESVNVEKAAGLSNWVWGNIAPSPLEWVKNQQDPPNTWSASDGLAHHYSLLLKPMDLSKERYDAFLKWLEDDVFAHLLPANSVLLGAIAALVSKDIKHIVEDICDNESRIDS